MQTDDLMVPPPPVVRERLARHVREARLLRALLRLAERAAEERQRQAAPKPRHEAAEEGGGR